MWTYRVSDGELLNSDGVFEGTGYSGLKGICRNNSLMENVEDRGPIPRGRYTIEKPAYSDIHLGPIVMRLTMILGTSFGRTAFRIHGDNKNHDASHGCIILGPLLRAAIANSTDNILEVV